MKNGPTRLLFVGNSYTFRNDLPGLVAALAPLEITTRCIVAGGASLRRHINSGAVQQALDEAKWDVVVLQEQSTLPIKNAARFAASVRELDTVIRSHGALTALYQTWPRQNAPESQTVLSAAYSGLAAELGALLVPVGDVWCGVLESHPDLPLFDPDGSHPSPLGSYLTACVFAVKLWGAGPSTRPVPEGLQVESACAATVRNAIDSTGLVPTHSPSGAIEP